jgi:hypothetical protein
VSGLRRVAIRFGLVSLLALLGCRGSPKSERVHEAGSASRREGMPRPQRLTYRDCPKHQPHPCDVREEACQASLFDFVQCLYGVKGAPRPPVRFVAPTELHDRTLAFRSQLDTTRAPLDSAARALGLMAAPRGSTKSTGSRANALYAPERREVLFVDQEGMPNDRLLGTFILGHEFVHAIQDRDSRLKRVLSSRDQRTFDEELSVWSAIEGEAALYEEVLRSLDYQRLPRDWVPPRFRARTDSSDSDAARERRVLDSAFGSFPYTYGAHWATTEWLAGRSLLGSAVPVVSTHSVMAARHGWPAAETACAERGLASLSPSLRLKARESLGAWLVQAFVRRVTSDAALAHGAARDLRGDWLWVYSTERDASFAFAWKTCWESAGSASRMREVLRKRLESQHRSSVAVESNGSEVVAVLFDAAGDSSRPRRLAQSVLALSKQP